MDMDRETGGIDFGHQPRKTLRVEIELSHILCRVAVGIEIWRKESGCLRRVFHNPVGEHLDHTGS